MGNIDNKDDKGQSEPGFDAPEGADETPKGPLEDAKTIEVDTRSLAGQALGGQEEAAKPAFLDQSTMIAGPQEIGDLTGLKEILEKLKDAPSKKTMEEILHTLPPKSIVTINTQNSIHIFRIEGHYVAEFPEGYKPEGTEDDHYKKGSMPGTAIMMLTSTNTDVSPGLLRYIALNEKISIAQNVKFMFGGGNLGTPVSIEVVDPEYTEGVEPVFRKVEEEEVEENASATEA